MESNPGTQTRSSFGCCTHVCSHQAGTFSHSTSGTFFPTYLVHVPGCFRCNTFPFATPNLCNTLPLQHIPLCSTLPSQQLPFATPCNSFLLQHILLSSILPLQHLLFCTTFHLHVPFAISTLCNTFHLQHLRFSSQTFLHTTLSLHTVLVR